MTSVNSTRLTGLASGLDTDQVIKEMLTKEQSKVDKVYQKKQTITWQQEKYQDIIKDTKGIYDKYFSATSNDYIMGSTSFSSLDVKATLNGVASNLVTATASAGANDVNYKLQILKMAQSDKYETASALISVDTGKRLSKVEKLSTGLTLPSDSKYKDVEIECTIKGDDGKTEVRKINIGLTGNMTKKDILEAMNKGIVDNSLAGDLDVHYEEKTGLFSIVKTEGSMVSSFKSDHDIFKSSFNKTIGEIAKEEVLKNPLVISVDDKVATDLKKVSISVSANDTIYTLCDKINKNSDLKGKLEANIKDGQLSITKVIDYKGTLSIEDKGGIVDIINAADVETKKLEDVNAVPKFYEPLKITVNKGGKKVDYTIDVSNLDSAYSLAKKINEELEGVVKASYSEVTGRFSIEGVAVGATSCIEVEDSNIAVSLGLTKTRNSQNMEACMFSKDISDKDIESFVKDKKRLEEIEDKLKVEANPDQKKIYETEKDDLVKKIENNKKLLYSTKSAKNSFSVDGVTYTLNGEGLVSLESSSNTDSTVDKMKGFIEDYNKMINNIYSSVTERKKSDYQPLTEEQKKSMKKEEIDNWEKEAKKGMLRNDNELRKFLDKMNKAVGSSLIKFGITNVDDYNKPGQIALDEKKFSKSLKDDGDSVYNKIDKMFTEMKSTIYGYVGSSRGIFAQKAGIEHTASAVKNLYSEQIKNKEQQMKNLVAKMKERENSLYKKFARLEASMNKFNSQMNYFGQMK